MNIFASASRANLASADFRLQRVAHVVLQIKDHSVIKGHRPKDEQNAAFESGASKLPWPHGKHNDFPSKAIDVRTWPSPDDMQALREEQIYLLGLYKGVGQSMSIPIRIGMDWDYDGEISDNGFDDGFHVEIDE